jgi:hypothetical protein
MPCAVELRVAKQNIDFLIVVITTKFQTKLFVFDLLVLKHNSTKLQWRICSVLFLFVKVNDFPELNYARRHIILWETVVYFHTFLKTEPSSPIRKRY